VGLAVAAEKTLGRILTEELIDVGNLISPPGVVPVVIKSLLFS
jgi:hypothetical protein